MKQRIIFSIITFFISFVSFITFAYTPKLSSIISFPISKSCASGLVACCNNTFLDISGLDAAHQNAIIGLNKMCIINGNSDLSTCGASSADPNARCFLPNQSVSRAEVIALIARYHQRVKDDWFIIAAADAQLNAFEDLIGVIDLQRYNLSAKSYGFSQGNVCEAWYTAPAYDPYDSRAIDPSITSCTDARNGVTSRRLMCLNGVNKCAGGLFDWNFGFHGIYRANSTYNPQFSATAVPLNQRSTYYNVYNPGGEECWGGTCYDFNTAGAPTTRSDFAYAMWQYYQDQDHDNACIISPTGSISANTGICSSSGTQATCSCIVHAGQSSCTAPVFWNSQNSSNRKIYIGDINTPWASGVSGSQVSSAVSPGSPLTYSLSARQYIYDNGTGDAAVTSSQIASLGLSAQNTTGSITASNCAINSGASSCTTTLTWSTTWITDPATVTVKNMNTGVIIATGLNGTTTTQIGSGTTNFGVYENGVLLTGASAGANAVQLRTITGTVRVDYNDNAAVDVAPNGPPDGLFADGTTITLTSSGGTVTTTTSNSSGAFSFANVSPGSYTVSIPSTINSANYPDGLHPSTVQTNPISVTISSSDATANFYISPYYRVTGGLFVDTNKNGKKDGGESYYTGGAITVTSSNGGTVSYPTSGVFQVARLPYGPVTITLTSSIPNGYVVTMPKGGAGSPSFTVQVGKTCAASPVAPTGGDGACNAAGNIYDINFGISNSTPWIQGVGLDMRFDTGVTNQVPSLSNSCGAIYTMMPSNAADTTTQGGVYIGSSSVNNAFGVRSTPSSNGWVMDTLFPETYKPVVSGTIRTSYSYVLGAVTRAGLTQTDINTDPNCSDPTISCSPINLPSGVYTHTGDVILSSLTLPANRNIILLIKGNLSITGNITVPTTSTLTVAVGDNNAGTAGNITVATSLGSAPACTAVAGQLQGFFTADKSMVISGTNDCTVGTDNMLTIEGAVVVNASLTSGAFTTNRDLCANDINYPIVVIRERPDFILHSPDVIKQQNYLFREAAP